MRTAVNLRNITAAAAVSAALVFGLAACNGNGVSGEQKAQNADSQTYDQVQPIPHFPYSVYREVGIDVEAIRALGEQTTSFFFNMGSPDPIFQCPSIGEPFPNTAELSNPDQVVNDGYPQGGQAVTVGQEDPDGIYAPSSSSGTFVLCVNSAGQKYAQYWEGFVDTVSGTAKWDSSHHQIVVYGAPIMPTCKVTGSGKSAKNTCTK